MPKVVLQCIRAIVTSPHHCHEATGVCFTIARFWSSLSVTPPRKMSLLNTGIGATTGGETSVGATSPYKHKHFFAFSPANPSHNTWAEKQRNRS